MDQHLVKMFVRIAVFVVHTGTFCFSSDLQVYLSLFSNHLVHAFHGHYNVTLLILEVLYCIFTPPSNMEGRLVLHI